MREMLAEVLWTYCYLPEGMAYRQGMSHLAGVLLLHLREPHLTCVCLASLLGGSPILRTCMSLHLQPSIDFFGTAHQGCEPSP